MYVIADIEWINPYENYTSPTQLAAARVDENWNVKDEFNAFIRPHRKGCCKWEHMAYTGGTSEDFMSAETAQEVFGRFKEWLNDDDIILWWHKQSKEQFCKMTETILGIKDSHKAVNINRYIYVFLSGQEHSVGSFYDIAEARGIDVRSDLKHYSVNDVRVLRELMIKIGYPQENLRYPIKTDSLVSDGKEFPYQYDPDTNTIHKKECIYIKDVKTTGHQTIKTAIKKKYKPCECCKEEYKAAVAERAADIISRCEYTYFYSPDSEVFHKRSCELMLSSEEIMGTGKYETVIATGRTPCKICNPTKEDEINSAVKKVNPVHFHKKEKKQVLPKAQAKALLRQQTAIKERKRLLKDNNLTEAERKDIITLTNTGFAFWVGKGYQNFHLHSCPKLNEVSDLKGFATYKEAVWSGYTPCRKCRPTEKHDAIYSIPINNCVRENDRVEVLEFMCRETGYEYYENDSYFYIDTPVGKWKIDTVTNPIKLEHINLVNNPHTKKYHEQPRLFLSYTDVFDYIKRHDESLAERKEKGRVFVKFFSQP